MLIYFQGVIIDKKHYCVDLNVSLCMCCSVGLFLNGRKEKVAKKKLLEPAVDKVWPPLPAETQFEGKHFMVHSHLITTLLRLYIVFNFIRLQ